MLVPPLTLNTQKLQVGEFDTPANLVANPQSLLMGFIRQTGSGSSRRLVGIANNANASSDDDDDDDTDNNDISTRTATTVASAASNNGNETDSASPPSSPDTATAVAGDGGAGAGAAASEEQAAVPAVGAVAAAGAAGAEGADQAAARDLSQVVVAADAGQSSEATPPARAVGSSPWTSQSPKPTE